MDDTLQGGAGYLLANKGLDGPVGDIEIVVVLEEVHQVFFQYRDMLREIQAFIRRQSGYHGLFKRYAVLIIV
jgi:hypothetical protein